MRELVFAIAISCPLAAYSMDGSSAAANVHAEITKEALSGMLAQNNLKAVVDANLSQDEPGSEGASEKRRHFDVSSINAAVQYINREKNKALNCAVEADSELDSRADALRHIGLMLHCVQDFYMRSNYVELELESEEHKDDPYNIPLVDWTKVPDGVFGVNSKIKLTSAKNEDPNDVLRKDSLTASGGKVLVSGKITQHAIARELAVRETQRQWNLFETILRSRCGDRAPAVIAALRKAAPPTAAQREANRNKEEQVIVGDPQDNPNTDELDPKDVR